MLRESLVGWFTNELVSTDAARVSLSKTEVKTKKSRYNVIKESLFLFFFNF